jgi:hypothetical protein
LHVFIGANFLCFRLAVGGSSGEAPEGQPRRLSYPFSGVEQESNGDCYSITPQRPMSGLNEAEK